MHTAICPACMKKVQLPKGVKVHDCPHCSSLLEYADQNPPKLDWAEDPFVYPSRRLMK